MEQLKIFSYENESISFKKINGSVYINATEMAKYFGKKPINFLKLESTIEFIAELNSEVTKNNFVDNQIIITNKGGDNGGGSSWFHEDIALEFARWLSPKFRVWCNNKIKELLTTGTTSLTIPKTFAEALRLAADQAEKIELQEKQIKQLEPKADYHDKVLQGENLITTTIIAKDLGMSATALNTLLNKHKIQYKRQGIWVLYDKYQGEGYTHTKTHVYTNSKGENFNSFLTYWTEKGRKFVTEFVMSL